MKNSKQTLIMLVLIPLLSVPVAAEIFRSKYAGEQMRSIKSLSADDIAELKRGGGWGLAKAAELNGVPGPAHILEMQGKIKLTDKQREQVEQIYNDMKNRAIVLGEKLIALEGVLNEGFAKNSIDSDKLQKLLNQIGEIRSSLRFVHLSTHLLTPEILSADQIILYNKLRGYTDDACQNIPKGHDAKMWKLHNGCSDG